MFHLVTDMFQEIIHLTGGNKEMTMNIELNDSFFKQIFQQKC